MTARIFSLEAHRTRLLFAEATALLRRSRQLLAAFQDLASSARGGSRHV